MQSVRISLVLLFKSSFPSLTSLHMLCSIFERQCNIIERASIENKTNILMNFTETPADFREIVIMFLFKIHFTDDYFQREALEAHNRYRMIHGAPPLKLDPQLSLEAEKFAKHLAKLGSARHDIKSSLRKQGEGENVARGCSEWGGLTASGAVHRW